MLRNLIKNLIKEHLDKGHKLYSQSLIGPGACAGTIPDHPNLIELPVSDSSNGFCVLGAALAQTSPVYLVRFAPFMAFNGNIFPYVGMAHNLGQPCKMFIRVMNTIGQIGPVATGSFTFYPLHFPNIKVVAPITCGEYSQIWNEFLVKDQVVYCSESRKSYDLANELPDLDLNSKTTLITCGETRLFGAELAQQFGFNLLNIFRLAPLIFNSEQIQLIEKSERIFFLDESYNEVGNYVAQYLLKEFNKSCLVIGLPHRTPGFSKQTDNIPTLTHYMNRLTRFL